jgi:hypothetical protein
VIVQCTEAFVDSLNRLSRTEAKAAKRFLRPLCAEIENLPPGLPITSIALSDHLICEERGGDLATAIGNDKIYGISFDEFYLAVAVLGKAPQICQLLIIAKKESR